MNKPKTKIKFTMFEKNMIIRVNVLFTIVIHNLLLINHKYISCNTIYKYVNYNNICVYM